MAWNRCLFPLILILVKLPRPCSFSAIPIEVVPTGNPLPDTPGEVLTHRSWAVPEGVEFGSLDRLKLVERGQPSTSSEPGPRVRVATRAVGLNFADIFCVLGLYGAANEARSRLSEKGFAAFVPGLEFSGVVVNAVSAPEQSPSGPGQAKPFKPGDRVLGFSRFGAYSDLVDVDPIFLKRLPDSWTFEQGASFIVQALTAWHGLVEVGHMPNLSTSSSSIRQDPYVVLIHSAAGGVGLWASEIAARRGGLVIGVVGNERKAEIFQNRIQNLSPGSVAMIRGDERTFDRRLAETLCDIRRRYHLRMEEEGAVVAQTKHRHVDNVKEASKNGWGADLVMESLGGKYFQASFEALNSGGALVKYGSTTYASPGLGRNMPRLLWRHFTRPRIDPGSLTSRNIRLAGFNLIFLTEQREELRRQLNACIACCCGDNKGGSNKSDSSDEVELDGVMPPLIGETLSFCTDAVKAMEKLKSGTTVGKVVLSNSDNRHAL